MRTFAVCLLIGDKTYKRTFPNTADGFEMLSEWLVQYTTEGIHACMEATGRYGLKLALHLIQSGFKVSIVNPKLVKKHAEAFNKQNKTDPNDAYICAHYAQTFKPRKWEPATQIRQQLADVVGQCALTKKAITAFTNRGKCGLESQAVMEVNKKTLASLTEQLEALVLLGEELLAQDEKLEQTVEILASAPGIGPVISLAMAAKIDFARFKQGRDLAFFLGLGPREWQSGETRRKGKLTKNGDDTLRALLRMGATSVTYTNPLLMEFAQRLRKKGLNEPQIISAVARKIVLIAHALVRRRTLYDCEYVNPLAKPKSAA